MRGTDADGPATLMLRPEQLSPRRSPTTTAATGVATVLASEFRGHDVLLTVDLGGDAAPITVRQHSVDPPAVDAKVRIGRDGRRVVPRRDIRSRAVMFDRLIEHLASHGDRVAVVTENRS